MIADALMLVYMALAQPAEARDRNQRAAFMREHPCPATGLTHGRCDGWVVDHVRPLCSGGPDHPSNMQWQTVEAARIKDRDEARQCAALRRQR